MSGQILNATATTEKVESQGAERQAGLPEMS